MLIEEIDKRRHNLKSIKDILALAVFRPTPEKLKQLMDEFYTSDGHAIFIAIDSGEVIGVIGIDTTDRPLGLITHIAVLPDKQRQGVGSRLINHTAEMLELETIEVETDQDTIDFYVACGFKTKEIESQYSGVRRFWCVKGVIGQR